MFAIDNLRIRKERIYKYDDIFPLAQLNFEGIKCYAPNNYIEILNNYYDDIYELPEDMLSHTHFIPNEDAFTMLNNVLKLHKDDCDK